MTLSRISRLSSLLCGTALALFTSAVTVPMANAQNADTIKRAVKEANERDTQAAAAARAAAEQRKRQAAERIRLRNERLQRAKALRARKGQPAPNVVVRTQPPPDAVRPVKQDANRIPPPQVQPGLPRRPFVRQAARPVPRVLDTPRSNLPASAPLSVRMAKVPRHIDQIKKARAQSFDRANNRVVIREPDDRVIVKQNNRAVVVSNENARLARVAKTRNLKRGDGTNVTIIQRPNNVTIYNVTNNNGQLVRRYRRDRYGHEYNMIDNRGRDRFNENLALGVGIGVGVAAGAILLHSLVDVPPPRVTIPPRKYIVDYDSASDDDVYEAVTAPPVDNIERRYTLDEVRATPRLRDRMRRIDLNDINFETGSWDVDPSQYGKLERVARAMRRAIDDNPNEVFMIEGYTDAVGAEEDNLTLSDRRAESVSIILSERFGVQPENLTTQGYGEDYLKIATSGPERLNRRVAVRRITPLIAQGDAVAAPR